MYVKLFQSILDSSIWMEDPTTRLVWITLLLLANPDGIVEMPVPAIAARAHVSLQDVKRALQILESPDEYSRTPDEDGRRLIRLHQRAPIWKIVNYEKYRAMRSPEARREYMREYMRRYRNRKQYDEGDLLAKKFTNASGAANNGLTVNPCKPVLAQEEADTEEEETYNTEDSRSSDRATIHTHAHSGADAPTTADAVAESVSSEKRKSPEQYTKEFLRFWEAYPCKKGKRTAFQAWKRAKERGAPPVDELIQAVEELKSCDRGWRDGYIPHPATWLNRDGWEDEPQSDVSPEYEEDLEDLFGGEE